MGGGCVERYPVGQQTVQDNRDFGFWLGKMLDGGQRQLVGHGHGGRRGEENKDVGAGRLARVRIEAQSAQWRQRGGEGMTDG